MARVIVFACVAMIACGRSNFDAINDGPDGIANPCTATLLDGLSGWWKLDETSGTIAADSAGTATGQLFGAPTWIEGRVGGALHFPGGNDRVGVGTQLSIGLQYPMTLSAWVKPDVLVSVSRHSIVGRDESAARQFEWGIAADRQPAVTLYPDCVSTPQDWVVSDNTVAGDGVWTHVAVTFADSRAVVHYVNGIASGGSVVPSATTCGTSATTYIGGTPYGPYPWQGAIDEVRLYQRTLSECEIKEVYCDGTWHCSNGVADCGETGVDRGADCDGG